MDLDAIRAYYRTILPFYERESAARPDLAFWRALAAEWRPRRVLELGAGAGRVTAALAEAAEVVGIDISLEMLGRAADRLRGRPGVYLVAADMCRLPFRARFDLIAAPNDPLSHLTRARHRRAALAGAARLLAPGGRLVIEGLYRPPGARSWETERCLPGAEGTLVVRERWRPAGPPQVWRARYTYRYADAPARPPVEAAFLARAWSRTEVETLLPATGLVPEALWGDFDQRPFAPDGERLIIVARPNAERRTPNRSDASVVVSPGARLFGARYN